MAKYSDEEFERIKVEGEELYKNLRSIYCPYFKNKIAFNSKGIEHLKFIRRNKACLPKDQFMRFKLIKLAPLILGLSSTLQGVRETKLFEEVRVHNRTEYKLLPVYYYEFVAVIKRDRVKIIVKQVNYGELYFWSIIPFWKMNIETMQRILHDGDLEVD